jgi:hypothetical protein
MELIVLVYLAVGTSNTDDTQSVSVVERRRGEKRSETDRQNTHLRRLPVQSALAGRPRLC